MFSQMLKGQSVVPVVAVASADQAIGLADALQQGGVNVIEVTLRSSFAIDALALIKREFPSMVVLAGTVNSPEQFRAVANVGVDGVISPGLTSALATTAKDLGVPYLPGVATASDIIRALEFDLTELKLFPASVVGGVGALKAFSGPFQNVSFCPTGGISKSDYKDYLALPNVMCVGGSWMASNERIQQHEWKAITEDCKKLTGRS